MTKKNIKFMAGAMLIAALAAGCSANNAGDTRSQASSAAETSSAAATEASTEAKEYKVSLNMDLANAIGETLDTVKMSFGEPESDESVELMHILKYKDSGRVFAIYKEDVLIGEAAGSCWTIKTKAGDLFAMSEDVIPVKDFLELASDEGSYKPMYYVNEYEDDFTVGSVGQNTVTFLSDGYMITIALSKDGEVMKDAEAGIYSAEPVAYTGADETTASMKDMEESKDETKASMEKETKEEMKKEKK